MAGDYNVRIKAILDVGDIQAQLDKLGKSAKTKVEVDNSQVTKGKKIVDQFGNALETTGKKGKQATEGISKGFKGLKGYLTEGENSFVGITKKVATFGLATNIIQGVGTAAKAMVGSVFELDASLTELRKVSGLTGQELQTFTKSAFEVGQEVGRTGIEVTDAATEFAKMGHSVNESLELSRISTMFQNVADSEISAGDAATFINSQLVAFNLTASDAINVIDKVNEVSNNYAVSSTELSSALEGSAAALAANNNSMDQSIALVTAGLEVMPGQANRMGNALRTIGIRIGALAKESDTWVAANGKVNVSLKDSQGNLRSTYDIMQDLYNGVEGQSAAWNTLTDSERLAISQTAAGTTRFTEFRAVMDNFTTAINANQTALNSQGSAAKENEAFMDSLEGKLKQLQSAFADLANKLINSDFIKGIIDIGTAILKVASSDFGQFAIKATAVIAVIKLLSSGFQKLVTTMGGFSLSKLINGFSGLNQEVGNVNSTVKNTRRAFDAIDDIADIADNASDSMRTLGSASESAGNAGGKIGGKIAGSISGVVSKIGLVGAAIGTLYSAAEAYQGHLEQTAADSYSAWQQSKEQIQANQTEIQGLLDKEGELTQVEKDRLAFLIDQTAELQEQQGLLASQALQDAWNAATGGKAGRFFSGKWGDNAELDKYDYYIERLSDAEDQINRALRGNHVESNLKYYDENISKVQEAVAEGKEYIELLEETEAAGGHVTEGQRSLAEQYQEIIDKYGKLTEFDSSDVEKFHNMFTDVNWEELSDEDFTKLQDRFNVVMDAISDSSEKGIEAFNLLNKSAGKSMESLGKFDPKTEMWTFNSQSVQEFADAWGISAEYADQILTNMTKAGQIKWNISEEQITNFSKSLVQTNNALTTTDGKIVTTADQFNKLGQSMGYPQAVIDQMRQAYVDAGNTLIDFSADTSTVIGQLKGLGEAAGIAVDSAGNIESINVDHLASSIKQLGGSKEDLANLLTSLHGMEGVSFTGTDIGLDEVIWGSEQAEAAVEELWSAVESGDGLTFDFDIDNPIDKVDELTELIDDMPEDKSITLQTIDKATGELKSVTISAEEFENEYVADLSVQDRASTALAYAAAVAAGYDGTYTAWLETKDGQTVLSELSAVEEKSKSETKTVTVDANTDTANQKVESLKTKIKNTKPKVEVGANTDPANTTVKNWSPPSKTVKVYAQIIENKKAKGKKKGEPGGMAWVGDEGSRSNPKPELIQTKRGAYLAGTSGWEMVPLADDDIVYSNAETKRLLGNNYQASSGFIPRFASGTPKFLDDKSESESVKNKIDAWSNEVDKWEHEVDVGRKSTSDYIRWLMGQYKKANKMTEDQYRKAEKEIWDYYNAYEEAALENYITQVKYGKMSLQDTLNYIFQAQKAAKISKDQEDELEEEAYKAHVEYNLARFENSEITYAEMKKVLEDFAAYQKTWGKTSVEDYYDYLDDLAEAAKDKELERLEQLQEEEENKQELGKLYAQLQVDNIDKQIEALERENEEQERANELAELYNNLAQARQKRVKIYRDGQFVYEQDREALKEAQDAIDDFNAEHATDELEKVKEQWQAILDMFDDQETLADIKKLENALGKTAEELFGVMGVDLTAWTEWFKTTLATGMGLEDIITQLDNLEGFDKINKYLNSQGQVNWSAIEQAIKNNRFANGTTNAPGGFSIVGERGWELTALSKGDAVFPHSISENLMRWGQFNPADFRFMPTNNDSIQSFNFEQLVLPNVHNAEDFISELQKLPNTAIQRSGGRR